MMGMERFVTCHILGLTFAWVLSGVTEKAWHIMLYKTFNWVNRQNPTKILNFWLLYILQMPYKIMRNVQICYHNVKVACWLWYEQFVFGKVVERGPHMLLALALFFLKRKNNFAFPETYQNLNAYMNMNTWENIICVAIAMETLIKRETYEYENYSSW